MQIDRFCEGLLGFLQASPTPFHAVQTMIAALDRAGFEHLDENQQWFPLPKGNYYTTRNDSSLIAFRLGNTSQATPYSNHSRLGFNMVGAHTDSPCLKLKPNPDKNTHPYWQLGTEVYGSPLMHTWFDRDLSIAGRIHYVDQCNELHSRLIDFEKSVGYIPSLAIHLNRNANSESKVNAQEHLLPILCTHLNDNPCSLKSAILDRLNYSADRQAKELLDYDLYLYDCQPPQLVGLNDEYIASARLDNLLSCYIGLMGLINSDDGQRSLLVCNDHEEIGSQSACGAQGPFLSDTLKRLFNNNDTYSQCVAQSLLISVDNAHAQHPNYPNKHDTNHAPIMNKGPVIKVNANHRYATTSETSAIIQYLAQVIDVPLQNFVSRADLSCGSTIGPLTSSEIGVRTLDMGVPQLAMHSIREIAGKEDAYSLFNLLSSFFSLPAVPEANPILPQSDTNKPNRSRSQDRSRGRRSRRGRSSSENASQNRHKNTSRTNTTKETKHTPRRKNEAQVKDDAIDEPLVEVNSQAQDSLEDAPNTKLGITEDHSPPPELDTQTEATSIDEPKAEHTEEQENEAQSSVLTTADELEKAETETETESASQQESPEKLETSSLETPPKESAETSEEPKSDTSVSGTEAIDKPKDD